MHVKLHFPAMPGQMIRGQADEVARRIEQSAAQLSYAASLAPTGETFGQKLKEAVQKRSGATRHKQQAERERNRYRPLKQRPHTKSD